MEITAEKFKASTGLDPVQDDLERCNCPYAGAIGHHWCGWDRERDMPAFIPGESKAAVPNAGSNGPSGVAAKVRVD
jgi:hypothetical protein